MTSHSETNNEGAGDPGSGDLGRSRLSSPDARVDLLVVGGGPAGTAAAFRATELGVDVLVVDFDDVMRRIRDYSKEKLILPGFGGGDRLAFPAGGDLVRSLEFDPVDKDEMWSSWKELYTAHQVPYATGVEFLDAEAVEIDASRWWRVRLFDHRQRSEHAVLARCLALAVGRGVPRRFDIPGNTDGIHFRLGNASDFVGAPACVVGGGTSAAEAVIAISNAKAEAGDETEIYWSYRGDRMPRVSQALAEVFFSAYVGNGNIRYFPRSEPAAVVAGDDQRDYLAIRVDRRCLEGRPNETSHLEFPKEQCLACIGEDLPTDLLGKIGIEAVEGGRKGRRRMAVSAVLESQQRGVFLLGDLLSQAHLRVSDWTSDPADWEEVRHPGNIKMALRDGVVVAEAVAQRIEGVEDPVVDLRDSPHRSDPPASLDVAAGEQQVESRRYRTDAMERTTPAAVVYARTPAGEVEELATLDVQGTLALGRSGVDLEFEHDPLLDPHHATLRHDPVNGVVLEDCGAAGGTFLRLKAGQRTRLQTGDLLQAGRQFLQLAAADNGFHLAHYDARGAAVSTYALTPDWQLFGRDAPDVTLDSTDSTLSRRQVALAVVDGAVEAKDLGSANGTFLRVSGALQLEHGAVFRIGRQGLTVGIGEEPVDQDVAVRVLRKSGAEAQSSAGAGQEPPASAPAGPSVTFQPDGRTFPIRPGQSICDLAEEQGVAITAECHAGICGSDPIRVLSGAEHLVQIDAQERETLEDVCELEPGPCRLACLARVTGPVVVEIVRD